MTLRPRHAHFSQPWVDQQAGLSCWGLKANKHIVKKISSKFSSVTLRQNFRSPFLFQRFFFWKSIIYQKICNFGKNLSTKLQKVIEFFEKKIFETWSWKIDLKDSIFSMGQMFFLLFCSFNIFCVFCWRSVFHPRLEKCSNIGFQFKWLTST